MINISELTHSNLYSYPIDDCIEYINKIPEVKYEGNEKIKFHAYWFIGKEFGRKQTLLLKSYLATQNLEKTEFILWCNVDITDNDFLRPFLPYITFKIYNPIKESIDTPIEDRIDILSLNDEKNWSGGDLFRLLVLHNYGGIYLDMDMVLLRDFSPLFYQEFMYKWGCLPFDTSSDINGACMGIFKKSKLSFDLLQTIKSLPLSPLTTMWSSNLYKMVRKNNSNWSVLPAAFFNPEWQDDPNRNWGSNDNNAFADNPYKLYEGVFSWHWHNRWDNDIHPNSKWKKIEDIIENKLKKLNIPNE